MKPVIDCRDGCALIALLSAPQVLWAPLCPLAATLWCTQATCMDCCSAPQHLVYDSPLHGLCALDCAVTFNRVPAVEYLMGRAGIVVAPDTLLLDVMRDDDDVTVTTLLLERGGHTVDTLQRATTFAYTMQRERKAALLASALARATAAQALMEATSAAAVLDTLAVQVVDARARCDAAVVAYEDAATEAALRARASAARDAAQQHAARAMPQSLRLRDPSVSADERGRDGEDGDGDSNAMTGANTPVVC